MMSLDAAARALGGIVCNGQILCPGPGHTKRDRSLSVWIDTNALSGIRVHSHAGDDWRECRDYVKSRLGIIDQGRSPTRKIERSPIPKARTIDSASRRIERALKLWNQTKSAKSNTLVKIYLATRGLTLPPRADEVLRFDPEHPFRLEDGTTIRLPAMVTLYRDIVSNKPVAIHRTALKADGSDKADMPDGSNSKKMLGPVKGAAIKLDDDASVALGITIGEGIETCLAARQLGFQPCWASGSSGAIETFPILTGVEALTILCEDDDTGANERAVAKCSNRWLAAGREVLTVKPIHGGDANDALERLTQNG